MRKIEYADELVTIEGALQFDAGAEGRVEGGEQNTQKNCRRGRNADDNSFISIPFILKRRVA